VAGTGSGTAGEALTGVPEAGGNAAGAAAPAPGRRDRLRQATAAEIRQTARRILVAEGPDAVSLRAIAREMGMTAPALYRYFTSREDLIRHVVADIFAELAADIRAAVSRASETDGSVTAKLIAACQEFRRWSLGHHEEFGLVFGSPLPGMHELDDEVIDPCALQFSDTFFSLFLELWRKQPFPVPADEEIEPRLRAQLARYREATGTALPLGTTLVFLQCWVRLYGVLSLEVFGHLRWALEDPAPLFELTLADLARLLGLSYP
jgi:AcrR family transcriptional regulator